MTASNFLACFNETASFEGGYANDPHDPGGATMAGVTQATYAAWLTKHGRPDAPVKGISLTDRQGLYRELFWNAVRADELYDGLDLVMTDTAWGSGPAKAIKLLQGVLDFTGDAVDGKFGPKTMAALQGVHVDLRPSVIDTLCQARMEFFQGLSDWKYFGKGWTTRLNGIRVMAGRMYAASLTTPTRVNQPPTTVSPLAPQPSLVDRIAVVEKQIGRITPQAKHESWLAKLEAHVAEFFSFG